MKYPSFFILLLISALCHSQTDAEIDAFTVEICKAINEEKGADSTRIDNALIKHYPAFLNKHKVDSEEKFIAIYDKVFFRLQKNCETFVEILNAEFVEKGDWKRLSEKPHHKLKKKACREISAIKNFYYLESDGTKTTVTVDKGYWQEVFADGTFSRLYFRWTGECEFELEFIESNNYSRKNLSNKGDKYVYGIFGKSEHGYDIWTENAGSKIYMSFRLYTDK